MTSLPLQFPYPEPAQRIARLRPECAARYPEIPCGIWLTAWSAAWVVTAGVFGGTRSWPGPSSRVLLEECFEFLGGARRPPGWNRRGSRQDDP